MSRTETLRILASGTVVVPIGLDLNDLKLERVSRNTIRLDFDVLRKVWIASGHESMLFNSVGTSELCAFVARWHREYELAGGMTDWKQAEIAHFLGDDTELHRLIPC